MKHVYRLTLIVGILLASAVATGQSSKPTRVMSIRVSDAISQKPLSDARVESRIDETVKQIAANRDGVARVEFPDGPIDFLHIQVFAPGHVPIETSWRDDGFDTWPPAPLLDVPMTPGEAIGGVVVDQSGKPVEGAMLKLSYWPVNRPKSEFYPRLTRFAVMTDRAGRWRCDAAPAGEITGYIDVSHPDFPMQPQARPELTELRAATARVALKPGVRLRGRVIAKDGRPIEGATLRWNPTNRFVDVAARSGANGNFQFNQVSESGARVLIRAPGFAPRIETVNPTKESPPIELVLSPARIATGQIVDSTFLPLAGNILVLGPREIGGGVLWEQPTDQQGRFSIDIGDEPVQIIAAVRGYSQEGDEKFLHPGDANVLRMMRRKQIFGTVSDAQSGEPITEAVVEPAITGVPHDPQFSRTNPMQIKGGRFSHFYNKPTMLRFVAPGYEPLISPVFDAEGKTRFDVKLKRDAAAESLVGFVIDAAGKPVAGAPVLVLTGQDYAQIDLSNMESFNTSARRQFTDADGKFAFDPPAEPFHILAMGAEGFAQVSEDAFRADARVPLAPWGKVDGAVRFGNLPYANSDLFVKRQKRGEQDDPRVDFVFNARTDAEGKFKLDRAPPGILLIARPNPNMNLEVAASSAQAAIDVQPGQASTVRIGGVGRTIVGKLDIPAALAKSDWHVARARIASPEENDADEPLRFANFAIERDGSFKIPDVEPGKYELEVIITERPKSGDTLGEQPVLASARQQFAVDPSNGRAADTKIRLDGIVVLSGP